MLRLFAAPLRLLCRHLFATLKENPQWNNYFGKKPELAGKFAAPEMGKEAHQFGYVVSDDFSKQINSPHN